MLYVDRFLGEIVKEKDKFAPPERYYEYRKGNHDNIITETYIVEYDPLKVVDFSYEIIASTNDEKRNKLNNDRKRFFEEYNIPSFDRLYAYTVPPKWYEAEAAKYNVEKVL